MSFSFSTLFWCPSIGFLFVLLFVPFRYIYRERYAAGLSKLPDGNKARLIRSERAIIAALKIILWLSPLYLIFIPLIFFYFERDIFVSGTVCMVLLVVTALEESWLRNWLIKYLENAKARSTLSA